MIFDGTEKIIGRGAQAEVFLYRGFAYKVYKPTYPAEWIAFEKHQQREINKAGLCPKYGVFIVSKKKLSGVLYKNYRIGILCNPLVW